jgi:hypothetical protein
LTRALIRYADEAAERGSTLKQWGKLAAIVNGLRQLEDDIYAELVPPERTQLELMRISHRQFVWKQQRPTSKWTIRYYKLFNTDDINPLCVAATGLTVDEIFLIGMAFLGTFIGNPCTIERMNIELPGIAREQIDCFIRVTARSLA